MTDAALSIVVFSAPLLLATLGALVSERAGVLAVFMDGAISLAGFACVAVSAATGNAALGFLAAVAATVAVLAGVALFNESTGANPFITGLAVNLLATGATSWLSARIFGTRGVVPLADGISNFASARPVFIVAPYLAAIALSVLFRHTSFGLNLAATGEEPNAARARGVSPERYRTASWAIAAFFAACAGSELALSIGAWVPNLSAGRGWTALAACYLGRRDPLLCVAAVLLFSVTEWATTVLQGGNLVPATILLGLPYLLALVAFVLTPSKR